MDFYYSVESAPCRAVLMVAKALNIELNKKLLPVREGKHLTPEFLKLNPQHTVPTLVDNGFALWESRAILIYLVEKYAKDDALYPKCPQKRAVVNQRLFFDMDLYGRFRAFWFPQVFQKAPADPELLQKLHNQYGILDAFLNGQTYVAGDNLTIADISLLASISTTDAAGMKLGEYPNLLRWYEQCKKVVPGADENWEGSLAWAKSKKLSN